MAASELSWLSSDVRGQALPRRSHWSRVALCVVGIVTAPLIVLPVVRSGGLAVLSGVLLERADELLAVLQASGWQHMRTDQEQDWVAVLMRRP